MNVSLRLLCTASVLLCLSLNAPLRADTPDPPFTGVVAGDDLNVRAGAGDNYYVVLQLDRDAIVEVEDELFGWFEIAPPESAFSYISKAFVNATGDGSTGVVNANRVRVRAPSPAGPSKSYRTQLTLNDGDEVTIIDEEDGYYRIQPPEGASLYVSAEFIEAASDAQIAAAGGEDATDDSDDDPEPVAEEDDEEDADGDEVAMADEDEAEADAEEASGEATAEDSESDDESMDEEDAEDSDDAEDDEESDEEPDDDDASDDEADDSEAESESEPTVPAVEESEIAIRADGTVLYAEQVIQGETLTQTLAAIAEEFDSITVHASTDAPSREVFGLLDQARQAGIENLALRSVAEGIDPSQPTLTDSVDETDDEAVEVAQADDSDEAMDEGDADAESTDEGDDEAGDDESAVASAEDGEDEPGEADEEEDEPSEPLTFEELEQRYAEMSERPLRDQSIGELRMRYEQMRVEDDLGRRERRLADARIEILSMRQELQASLLELNAVEEESNEAQQRREEEDAARPKEYAAIGRLNTSTLYTGEKLPLLYRVIDPLTGRTVAYVDPGEVDPINLIGKYVGVEGRRDYDGALGLYVVTAKSIDELTADDIEN